LPARRDGSATLAMVGRYPRSLNKFSWDRGRKNLLIDKPPFAEMRMSDCHFMMTVVSIQRRGELMSWTTMLCGKTMVTQRGRAAGLHHCYGPASGCAPTKLALLVACLLPFTFESSTPQETAALLAVIAGQWLISIISSDSSDSSGQAS